MHKRTSAQVAYRVRRVSAIPLAEPGHSGPWFPLTLRVRVSGAGEPENRAPNRHLKEKYFPGSMYTRWEYRHAFLTSAMLLLLNKIHSSTRECMIFHRIWLSGL